jgi:hypothetical protein
LDTLKICLSASYSAFPIVNCFFVWYKHFFFLFALVSRRILCHLKNLHPGYYRPLLKFTKRHISQANCQGEECCFGECFALPTSAFQIMLHAPHHRGTTPSQSLVNPEGRRDRTGDLLILKKDKKCNLMVKTGHFL